MNNRVTAVMIESAYLLRAGMEQLFNEIPGLVLLEVFDGTEKNLSQKVLQLSPDVVIIDSNCIKESESSLINEFNDNHIFLIGLVSKHTPENIKSHYKGCVNLRDDKFELVKQLKAILGDKLEKNKPVQNQSLLSDREKTIVKQVVNGFTNQEIADKLYLSIHTVTTHRKNISNKLGIKTVSGLTVYALMHKIVEIHDIEHR